MIADAEPVAPIVVRKPKLRRGEFYFLIDPVTREEIKLPGVSAALSEEAKPYLLTWAAKQAAEWAIMNPDATFEEIANAHNRTKEKAGVKGDQVHAWAAEYQSGRELPLESLMPEAKPYAGAFLRYVKAERPSFLRTEVTGFNLTWGYAGTFDYTAADLGETHFLGDWKTGKGVYDEVAWQLSAYRHFEWAVRVNEQNGKLDLEPFTPVEYAVAIHLKRDGTYSKLEQPDKWPIFLAYLHLWREKRGIPCPPACTFVGMGGTE